MTTLLANNSYKKIIFVNKIQVDLKYTSVTCKIEC